MLEETTPETTPDTASPAPKKKRSRIKPALILLVLMLLSLAVMWAIQESRTSHLQAKVFAKMAKKIRPDQLLLNTASYQGARCGGMVLLRTLAPRVRIQ